MGGSSWSNAAYNSKAVLRTASNKPVFAYSAAVDAGEVEAKVHQSLNPNGIKLRESRDSAEHPESNAIFVALDVTGSMGKVVKGIHEKLPSLMTLLNDHGYIKDPAILMAAVGDAPDDKYPLQVGQFESGIEIENDITNMILEGGGGGTMKESYELAAYIGARKTSIDCLEKRGKKGYFFFIGDEKPYDNVSSKEVGAIIGDKLQKSISTESIFKELKEKYNVFFILPEGASHGGDESVISAWADLVGKENVLRLKKASAVAELIATQIGLCEGTTDLEKAAEDMQKNGAEKGDIEHVTKSVKLSNIPAELAGTLKKTGGAEKIERL